MSRGGRSSKDKGARFEKEIARQLTFQLTGCKEPEIFWRTSTSGGRATHMLKRGKMTKMHGDILAIDEKGIWLTDHVMIECKNVRHYDFSLILEGKGDVWDWWKKLSVQAKQAKKIPLLLMKRTASKTYAVYHFDHQCCFRLNEKRNEKYERFVIERKWPVVNLIITPFENVLPNLNRYWIEKFYEPINPTSGALPTVTVGSRSDTPVCSSPLSHRKKDD